MWLHCVVMEPMLVVRAHCAMAPLGARGRSCRLLDQGWTVFVAAQRPVCHWYSCIRRPWVARCSPGVGANQSWQWYLLCWLGLDTRADECHWYTWLMPEAAPGVLVRLLEQAFGLLFA